MIKKKKWILGIPLLIILQWALLMILTYNRIPNYYFMSPQDVPHFISHEEEFAMLLHAYQRDVKIILYGLYGAFLFGTITYIFLNQIRYQSGSRCMYTVLRLPIKAIRLKFFFHQIKKPVVAVLIAFCMELTVLHISNQSFLSMTALPLDVPVFQESMHADAWLNGFCPWGLLIAVPIVIMMTAVLCIFSYKD